MKIRDSYAEINGDKEVVEMPSGALDVVADDGRTLFSLHLNGGVLEVSTGGLCKHGGEVLDSKIALKPKSTNEVAITRDTWK